MRNHTDDELDDLESGFRGAFLHHLGQTRAKSGRKPNSNRFWRESDKGGKGSGNWGHAGRPGKVGGSAPVGEGAAGRVSKRPIRDQFAEYIYNLPRFSIRELPFFVEAGTTHKKQREAIAEGIEMIGKAHTAKRDIDIPATKVGFVNTTTSEMRVEVALCRSDPSRNRFSINVSTSSRRESAGEDFCHEVGHIIDHVTDETPEKEAVLSAIQKSGAVLKLSGMLLAPVSTISVEKTNGETGFAMQSLSEHRDYVRYLLRPNELFARAYAQYAVLRSKNKAAMQRMDYYRSGFEKVDAKARHVTRGARKFTEFTYPTQWTDADFEPIAQAFDALFEAHGR